MLLVALLVAVTATAQSLHLPDATSEAAILAANSSTPGGDVSAVDSTTAVLTPRSHMTPSAPPPATTATTAGVENVTTSLRLNDPPLVTRPWRSFQETRPTLAADNFPPLATSQSGIIITADFSSGDEQQQDPVKVKPLQKNSLPFRTKFLDKMTLGPIEISTILHQIISPPSTTRRKSMSSTKNAFNFRNNVELKTTFVTAVPEDDTDQGFPREGLQEDIDIPFLQTEPNNPYIHWDSDSEEQEREMELQRLGDESPENMRFSLDGNKLDDGDGFAAPSSPSPATPTGRSYLLLLAGNSTIVKLRQRDFAKYLKLNLAARLSLEYDDVRVNRVVLAPPRLLVNVSVVTPSEAASEDTVEEEVVDENILKEEAPLHMMAETNATLLELSGEEYHVVRLLSLRSNPSDKDSVQDDVATASTIVNDRHDDIEFVIYTILGGTCGIVVVASLLLTVSRFVRVIEIPWPWRRAKHLTSTWSLPAGRPRHVRMGDDVPNAPPPTVIYSGTFAARAAAAANPTGAASWVDEYRPRGNAADDQGFAVGRVKLLPKNPMYADLEMGGGMMMSYTDRLEAANQQVRESPSKLRMYSCRPGSLVIPLPPLPKTATAQPAKDCAVQGAADTHPLDVRIKEGTVGHDNPNYQTS